ncbi:helix-turn-helix domain-containing protein [Paraburkholderia phenazinium]|uniref:Transcriptional regulator, AraC family n=1 Tax=Paraburkholderia phenazinium TaxID=60549 RepID=A0A1G8AUS2_9BURK|nr:transcriptional regulator, AraC family [Paraburkholderia phenazinium]
MTLFSAEPELEGSYGSSIADAAAPDLADGFCVSTRVARDADEQARNLSGWRQTYDQLTPGAFSGSVSELCLLDMTVFCETTSHALRQTCEVGSDAYWFGIPLKNDGPGLIDGHLIADDALAVMRGRDEFELVTAGGYRILGVVIDEAELRTYAHEVERIDFSDEVLRRQILHVGAARKAHLCEALSILLQTAQEDSQPLSAVASANVQSCVLAMLFDLAGSWQTDDLPESRSKSDRYWIVMQARDYILANRNRPVSVPELCRQFHVSRRTLQYCFKETLGMTPMSYLRAIRLNGVRRDLSSPQDRLPKTVQGVAADWGFWHLSQFATDYRKLFGKLPSESLREAVQ